MRRAWLASMLVMAGCSCGPPLIGGVDASGPDAAADAGTPLDAERPRDARTITDRGFLDPDAACASQTASATVERAPVDIIWMVDNSVSMQPAIEQVQAGLNDFAALIGARDLDYRVIMLSLRGRGPDDVDDPSRYRVCIPPPLAGDASCGDGARFFHVDMDVYSTQQIEQFIGTLAQTPGYQEGDAHGSAPWRDLLRPEATKTIVVVTDDNARMVVRDGSGYAKPASGADGDPVATADWFETSASSDNPFNSRTLAEGILHPRWGGLFDGYTFSALYGWGSETDPSVLCTYPDDTEPPASGLTYTELVARTGGVRAQICAGPSAWGPFFDGVATAVERESRIDCTIQIPEPPEGSFFQRDRINVFVDVGAGPERVGKVSGGAACDARGGWHYDDEGDPMSVVLCPATCDSLQAAAGETRSVDVQFGCETIPI